MADPQAQWPPAPPGRLRLLTLGGCNLLEIGKALAGILDHRHLWNVSWPSMGSEPFTLEHWPDGPEFADLQGFLKRETEKPFDRIIRGAKPDIILLTVGQNVLNDYIVLGGRVIADFTNKLYLDDNRLEGRPRPSPAAFVAPGFSVITIESPEFAALCKGGFRRTYERLLRPLIDAGTKVLVHRHTLATQALTPEGTVDDDYPTIRFQSRLIEDLTAFATSFPGIEEFGQVEELNLTSDDAPNGRWGFHPIQDQYALQAYRLACRFLPDHAEKVLTSFLYRNRMEFLRMRERKMKAIESERAALEWRFAVENERQRVQRELDATHASLSWRITAPLRAVRRRMRRG